MSGETGRYVHTVHVIFPILNFTDSYTAFHTVSCGVLSGKTTQLPAYLLEDLNERGIGGEGYIICTQPRRIAAITVATRVAYEMQESAGKTVGYQVRLDNRCGPSTRVVYCTTGVLLRRLQHPDFLASVSHIVVDEVHERQVETDFLMTLLKQNAPRFPHLRLIMMSATMQEKLFSDYFSCPIIYVEGRCFNVQQHYIAEINKMVAVQQKEVALERGKDAPGRGGGEGQVKGRGVGQQLIPDDKCVAPSFDAERVAEVVIRIIQQYSKRDRIQNFQSETESPPTSQTGDAILVFLSGIAEISKVNKMLRQRNLSTLNAEVHQLHSSLPNEVQKRVFRKTKPGEWKIVLSTNIAETSVTVEDVTHVVDCGMVKVRRHCLLITPVYNDLIGTGHLFVPAL